MLCPGLIFGKLFDTCFYRYNCDSRSVTAPKIVSFTIATVGLIGRKMRFTSSYTLNSFIVLPQLLKIQFLLVDMANFCPGHILPAMLAVPAMLSLSALLAL